jgi:sulfur carrier protein
MRVSVNGHQRSLPDGSTVESVLGLLRGADCADAPTVPDARDQRGIAVALDGEVVPRSAWATTELRAGAVVEVLVAVQGG